MRSFLMIGLLVVCSGSMALAQTVIPLDPFETTIPPDVEMSITFPDDMADVDSMSIHMSGTLVAGLEQCFGDDSPVPTEEWPRVYLSADGIGVWESYIPYGTPPGEFDVTFTLSSYADDDHSGLAGTNQLIYCVFWLSNISCTYYEYPSATIETAELLLWYPDSTPVATRNWSSVKGLFQ